ncbi:phosphate-starvation-inducible PsiE family protein, partial [Acidithiobacillus ferrooxidans]|nr:phosphate-starvation-inducible PsiE family protein [Acidithiobacillus ferrooxidans]
EFNHTIFHSIQHRGQIVRVKTVVLIAILGISREYILLDAKPLHAAIIVGYGISILCLGIVYYVLDIRESSNSSFR